MRLLKLRFLLIPAAVAGLVAALPGVASAQRRGRPVVVRPAQRVVVGGRNYRPLFLDPWYSYYGFGLGYGWYPYPYGSSMYPYAPYGYGYGPYGSQVAEVRLEVTPKSAEVYVDGYRAGTVDDFDGFFQRLRVPPGEHDVVLYLDGYRTVHQQLYLGPGSDHKIRYTMVPLPSGEQPEPRPQPEAVSPRASGPPPAPARPGGPGRGGPGRGAPGRGGPPPRPAPPGPEANSQFGSVSVRVLPADADVLIDGERWTGPADQDRLVVQLSAGRHHIEIRKDGYETYSGDVEVAPGDTIPLNVSLLRR